MAAHPLRARPRHESLCQLRRLTANFGSRIAQRFRFWLLEAADDEQKREKCTGFWVDFYADKFHQAVSVPELFDWGRLVGVIKFMLPKIAVESLRNIYTQEKYVLEHF